MTEMLVKIQGVRFSEVSESHQLFAVVVALNNAVVGDTNGHNQHVWNGTGTHGVHHDGQYAGTSWRRLSAARTCAL